MEREPTIKERIELFIQRLLDNGFVEQDEDEVQQYIMFFIGTPYSIITMAAIRDQTSPVILLSILGQIRYMLKISLEKNQMH